MISLQPFASVIVALTLIGVVVLAVRLMALELLRITLETLGVAVPTTTLLVTFEAAIAR